MSGGWAGSDRKSRLPANWPALRTRVLKRDGYRCTHTDDYGRRCNEPASDVDHKIPGDNHREANLRSLCGWHHRGKSSSEGGAARAVQRRRAAAMLRRPDEHPSQYER